MPQLPDRRPIFVHASPRCGSTYFFNVLRRDPSLLCFNEAIIDVFSSFSKKEIEQYSERYKQEWNVNHHFLQAGDFDEMVEAWDTVMPFLPPFPSFRDYAPGDSLRQVYWKKSASAGRWIVKQTEISTEPGTAFPAISGTASGIYRRFSAAVTR